MCVFQSMFIWKASSLRYATLVDIWCASGAQGPSWDRSCTRQARLRPTREAHSCEMGPYPPRERLAHSLVLPGSLFARLRSIWSWYLVFKFVRLEGTLTFSFVECRTLRDASSIVYGLADIMSADEARWPVHIGIYGISLYWPEKIGYFMPTAWAARMTWGLIRIQ